MKYSVVTATSLEDAVRIKSQNPSWTLIAGGTDLLNRINMGIESHPVLISLEQANELKGISMSKGKVVIGSMTTLSEIARAVLPRSLSALQLAASVAASPQIRNSATIGGNVLQENRCMYFNESVSWRRVDCCFKLGGNRCYQYKGSKDCVALFQSDTAPALICLGATAVIAGPAGCRTIPLESLYLNKGRANRTLGKDEVLKEIQIPVTEHSVSSYSRRTIRGSIDFPLVSCACSMTFSGRTVENARIILGSAGPRPAEASTAEDLLIGKSKAEIMDMLDEISEKSKTGFLPFRDSRVDTPARKAMGMTVVKNAVSMALSQIE